MRNPPPPLLYPVQFWRQRFAHLRDTLLVLPSVQCSPRNAAGVLALEEEGFCFAVLEAEDLAITTDVEFALQSY